MLFDYNPYFYQDLDEKVLHFEDALENGEAWKLSADDYAQAVDVYLASGRPEDARQTQAMAREAFPQSAAVAASEALLLMVDRNRRQALRALWKALYLGPESPYVQLMWGCYYLTVNPAMTRRHFAKAVDFAPKQDKLQYHKKIGYLYCKQYMESEAMEHFGICVREGKFDPSVHFDLAVMQINQRQYAQALATIEPLIANDPYNEALWAMKSEAHLDLREAKEAMEAAEYALSLNPAESESLLAFVKACVDAKQDDRAIKRLTAYEKRYGGVNRDADDFPDDALGDDDFCNHILSLGLAYAEVGYFDDAVDYIGYLTDYHPNYSDGWFELGRLFYDEELFAESAFLFRAAVKRYPRDPEFWEYLGSARLRMGNDQAAADAFAAGWELRPSDGRMAELFIDAAIGVQPLASTLVFATNALALAPDHAPLRCWLAHCLAQTGHADMARSQMRKALLADPAQGKAFVAAHPKIFADSVFADIAAEVAGIAADNISPDPGAPL